MTLKHSVKNNFFYLKFLTSRICESSTEMIMLKFSFHSITGYISYLLHISHMNLCAKQNVSSFCYL